MTESTKVPHSSDVSPLPVDTVIHGDSLLILQSFPTNSVDALICDPPAGIFFMNRQFDHDKGGRDLWIAWLAGIMKEALRVMKPGGHAFIWSLPRTAHWTATALEDAGFEIRDKVYHTFAIDTKVQAFCSTLSQEQCNLFEQILDAQETPQSVLACFGSGFPKSNDTSKAIDKMLGAEREIVGKRDTRSLYDGRERISDQFVHMHEGWRSPWMDNQEGIERQKDITQPATPEAQQWQGWGSALKPSVEEWILCRKPLAESTIAKNVLKYGTGAINIDASRIGYVSDEDLASTEKRLEEMRQSVRGKSGAGGGSEGWKRPWMQDQEKVKARIHATPSGRWPAHLLLSHTLYCTEQACDESCPVLQMDEQSGMSKSDSSSYNWESSGNDNATNITNNIKSGRHFSDQGGASRYFKTFRPTLEDTAFLYTSKASRKERNSGCEALNTSPVHRYGAGIGEGKTPDAPVIERNNHPTVKSTKLMSYLATMITPTNGIVLDCFAGSGSTLVAAIAQGFHYIGIDEDEAYCAIARARTAHAHQEVQR